MGEIVGHAPLLFGLLLNNQNNNNGTNPADNNVNRDQTKPVVGTAVLQDRVTEAAYLRTLQSDEPILPRLHKKPNTAAANGPLARLTQAQLDDFNKNGYLVLSSLLTTDETNVLRSEAHDVVRNISEGADDKIIHYNLNDNVNSSPHPSPIGSVVAIFESTATIAAAPPIARLGCGIHILLPSFRYWTHHPFHRLLYTDLMPPIARNTRTNPLITQSQIIVKSGDNNGSAIVPHQDGCISFTDPPSCLTYWYALEDSTLENGCLEVLPGSHITEPLRQRVVKGNRGEPKFVDLDEVLRAEGGENEGKSKNEEGIQYAFGLSRDDGAKTRYVPLEVEKGTPVLFHGNLMHKSGKNRGGKGRMAYTFSVIDGEAKTDGDGYMEPEDGHLEKL